MEVGLLIAIGFALTFALTNGFHDAANAIATLVATRGAGRDAKKSVAAYVAARVTKRPAVWVVIGGAGLWLASIQDLPRTLQVMHLIAALWIVGWLARAVLRGSHLR